MLEQNGTELNTMYWNRTEWGEKRDALPLLQVNLRRRRLLGFFARFTVRFSARFLLATSTGPASPDVNTAYTTAHAHGQCMHAYDLKHGNKFLARPAPVLADSTSSATRLEMSAANERRFRPFSMRCAREADSGRCPARDQ